MFTQVANVDRLLTMVLTLDLGEDNHLAHNKEIRELYCSYISLRPKIVKLIDKYSQKCGYTELTVPSSYMQLT